MSLAFSPWRSFPVTFTPNAATLAEILDGGQAFRWRAVAADGTWIGAWDQALAHLRLTAQQQLQWQAPRPLLVATEAGLESYFGLNRDWAALADCLPWRSDLHLARCLVEFPQLRLLRQPFGETLLGFLCSATKQIVQIKQMMALLAERLGDELLPGHRRLPTWTQLARASESDLRRCLLGFRARYIHQTAQFLEKHPGWLEATEAAPYAMAKERLCSLPGVGEKVADCVLLFGAGCLEAFPVDVWILRALEQRYGLQGWKPAQVAQFGRAHFGPLAGLAQQYLFAWERREAARSGKK